MDCVYPLGKGSILKNFELRMSLRSIEKHLTGFNKVWIIGERPDWLQNIEHVPFNESPTADSDYNIMMKVTKACDTPEVSNDFLFMNDDHYLLATFNTANFPSYYQGTLSEYLKKRGLDAYGRRAKATMDHLMLRDLPIKYFDIHTPIVYNKELFKKYVSSLNWKDKTYIIKSLYANIVQSEGAPMIDNKHNRPPLQNETIFSTTPHMRASVTRALTERFPNKSRYERTDM